MTRNSDFKRVVRARAARTGESYQAARRSLLAQREKTNMTTYDAASIHRAETLDDIRRHPSRYITDTAAAGVTHLCLELLGNAIDEVEQGAADHIDVIVHADGAISVADNGRGIPVETTDGQSALEVAVLTPRSTAKRPGGPYRLPAGRNGLGLPVVAALCRRLQVTVDRDGRRHEAEFVSMDQHPGQVTKPATDIGASPQGRTGTQVTMWPDPDVFGAASIDLAALEERLGSLVALHAGVSIDLHDQRPGNPTTSTFSAPEGLVSLLPVEVQQEAKTGRASSNRGTATVAIAPAHGDAATARSFVNDLEIAAGDHIDPARDVVDGDHHLVVAFRIPDPVFTVEGAHVTLHSPAAAELVHTALRDANRH